MDYAELEEQFITGGESEEQHKLAGHNKFCTSVAVGTKTLFSGGGDDRLVCYREVEGKW